MSETLTAGTIGAWRLLFERERDEAHVDVLRRAAEQKITLCDMAARYQWLSAGRIIRLACIPDECVTGDCLDEAIDLWRGSEPLQETAKVK